ncbi:MAG: hypothetical protein LBF76_00175 [Holosporales bacterium]|jgi:hypothetical protein|nr:hypothetical protein [Holosporales bacterium]
MNIKILFGILTLLLSIEGQGMCFRRQARHGGDEAERRDETPSVPVLTPQQEFLNYVETIETNTPEKRQPAITSKGFPTAFRSLCSPIQHDVCTKVLRLGSSPHGDQDITSGLFASGQYSQILSLYGLSLKDVTHVAADIPGRIMTVDEDEYHFFKKLIAEGCNPVQMRAVLGAQNGFDIIVTDDSVTKNIGLFRDLELPPLDKKNALFAYIRQEGRLPEHDLCEQLRALRTCPIIRFYFPHHLAELLAVKGVVVLTDVDISIATESYYDLKEKRIVEVNVFERCYIERRPNWRHPEDKKIGAPIVRDGWRVQWGRDICPAVTISSPDPYEREIYKMTFFNSLQDLSHDLRIRNDERWRSAAFIASIGNPYGIYRRSRCGVLVIERVH